MKKTREEIIQEICSIESQLSDLHYAQKTATLDMDGNKKRNLSEAWVILSRQLKEGCPICRP